MERLLASVDAAVVAAFAGSIGASAAIVAAVTGLGGWRATKRIAHETAAQTRLQAQNWHVLRRPQFRVTCSRTHGDEIEMRVTLVGPPALDGIDEVIVRIRDDDLDHTYRAAGGLTADEVAAQVWAPYRFKPGVDGADKDGRSPEPIELMAGGSRRFVLVPTLPPRQGIPEAWRERYKDDPVRLELVARAGDESWRVAIDVELDC